MKKRTWLIATMVLALLLAVGTIYITDDYDESPSAAAVLTAERPDVTITQQPGRIIFRPDTIQAGLIFYPGGKVNYIAYAPLMADLAARGFLCVLEEMPLQLAFLKIDAADAAVADFPEVETWYLAGHSLGGIAASFCAARHTEQWEGLVLLGAYSTADLKESGLRVLSVYGSEDGVLNRDTYERNRANLPANTMEVVIPGGNHAAFGDYGPQKGDGQSTLDPGEQIQITADIISGWVFGKN